MPCIADTVYLAGPMTGWVDENRLSFEAAATWLRATGRHVASPAEFGLPEATPWADCMRVGIRALSYCGELLLLPGWKYSRGARKEADIAQTFGMPVSELSFEVMLQSARAEEGNRKGPLASHTITGYIAALAYAQLREHRPVDVLGHCLHFAMPRTPVLEPPHLEVIHPDGSVTEEVGGAPGDDGLTLAAILPLIVQLCTREDFCSPICAHPMAARKPTPSFAR